MNLISLIIAGSLLLAGPVPPTSGEVRVPLNEASEVDLAEVVARLAAATGTEMPRPPGAFTLPMDGLAGNLTRKIIAEDLGPDASVRRVGGFLVIRLDPATLAPDQNARWRPRLSRLAARLEREARRRSHYGMHALKSYRPNDAGRPTVCLVHGLNSSSGGFVYLIGPLQEAGYGVVVYDYPFNRDLDESARIFVADLKAFRREAGETRPWALVTHSMGALLARAYVEDPANDAGAVRSLIMIGPVNQGSSLAEAQTMVQLLGVQNTNDPLAHLGDGLGEAARDMLPGSRFLTALNRRPRRAGVAYHILAGDVGLLSEASRRQMDARIEALRREGGILGGLVRIAAADLGPRLDEISTGTGDGCVSVASTRLEGVDDHVTIHANHAELIRAPLLFSAPGPVACMPDVLRWLAADMPR